jgi:hypothetical protein
MGQESDAPMGAADTNSPGDASNSTDEAGDGSSISTDAQPGLDAILFPEAGIPTDAYLPDVSVPPADATTAPGDAGTYCSQIPGADVPDVLAPNNEAGAGKPYPCASYCPQDDFCFIPRWTPESGVDRDASNPTPGHCVVVTSICVAADRWLVPSGASATLSVFATFYDRYAGVFESGELSARGIDPTRLGWSIQNGTGSALGARDIYSARFNVTGKSLGDVTIKGTYGTVAMAMAMTVTPATVVGIDTILPQVLEPGRTYSLGARGHLSDQRSVDLSADVSWISSDASVLQVDSASRQATALKGGTVTLSTVYAGNAFTATTKVNPKPFVSLSLGLHSIAVGVGDASFVAVDAFDADGNGGPATDQITLSTSAPDIAQLFNDRTEKNVLFTAPGPVTITAKLGALTTSRTYDVLDSRPRVTQLLAIEPANAMVPEGVQETFNVRANFSDGTSGYATAHWSSADPGVVALINRWNGVFNGEFMGGVAGATTLTAIHGPYTLTAPVTSIRDWVYRDGH